MEIYMCVCVCVCVYQSQSLHNMLVKSRWSSWTVQKYSSCQVPKNITALVQIVLVQSSLSTYKIKKREHELLFFSGSILSRAKCIVEYIYNKKSVYNITRQNCNRIKFILRYGFKSQPPDTLVKIRSSMSPICFMLLFFCLSFVLAHGVAREFRLPRRLSEQIKSVCVFVCSLHPPQSFESASLVVRATENQRS